MGKLSDFNQMNYKGIRIFLYMEICILYVQDLVGQNLVYCITSIESLMSWVKIYHMKYFKKSPQTIWNYSEIWKRALRLIYNWQYKHFMYIMS